VVFAGGVVASFWALGLLLVILKSGGEQLGWGFQLQNPTFVTALTYLMFFLALSFFGIFEIGTSLMGMGSQYSGKKGYLGTFASGVLATVVATPCTAPFMGSALGWALTQPAGISMAVMTSLGVGMAAPYVVLCSVPGLLRYMPKPGNWMVTLKQFFGFMLMGAVVFLLHVLSQQVSELRFTLVLVALVLLGLGAWVLGNWGAPQRSFRSRWTARTVALATVALAFTVPLYQPAEHIEWREFSPERLAELRREGTPVFIDFTASWCLTCKLNEASFTAEVARKFEEKGIVPLKADWTDPDPEIAAAVQSYGREGIPLYVLYGAGKDREAMILPELITQRILLNHLEKI